MSNLIVRTTLFSCNISPCSAYPFLEVAVSPGIVPLSRHSPPFSPPRSPWSSYVSLDLLSCNIHLLNRLMSSICPFVHIPGMLIFPPIYCFTVTSTSTCTFVQVSYLFPFHGQKSSVYSSGVSNPQRYTIQCSVVILLPLRPSVYR